jgi:hypothetical protein
LAEESLQIDRKLFQLQEMDRLREADRLKIENLELKLSNEERTNHQ